MWLTRISIQHPVFASMMMLALMVLGLASWQKIGVEEFPNVEFPFVVVYTNYPGASPEIVEADVTRKIEDSVNTIGGVKQVTSISREGLSTVIIEFQLSVPAALAAQDVRDKIATIKGQLRDEVEEPLIERYDPSAAPVVSVAFRSDSLPMRELSNYLDQYIVKRLQTLNGVGRVNLLGTTKRQIRIEIDAKKMQAFGVGIDQLNQVLSTENMQLPSGTLNTGLQELVVQVNGRLTDPQDFNRLIVARRNGAPVYLSQVATVYDTQVEMESAAFINGQPAIGIDIIRSSGANVIEVVDRSYAELDEIKKILPAGIEMTVVADSAKSIRASLKDVVRTMIEGGVLAILIVLLFLGSWRSTVITALTLPISLLGTLAVMWVFNFTLNTMTLLAMALSVGLLIDDAIVVRENIVRHGAMGKTHKQAALDGTEEIGLAVLATSLVIVAVFLPVAFMGGIIGRFFYQFGVVVSAAVLISTLVAFTLDPMLSAIWPETPKDPNKRGWLRRLLDAFARLQDRMADAYVAMLRWCLRYRKTTLAIALGSLLGAFVLAGMIGKEFLPTPDLGEMAVKFETPIDSSLEYTSVKVAQVDAVLREFPEVNATYATVNSLSNQGKHKAQIRVRLKSKQQRQRGLEELNQAVRQRRADIENLSIASSKIDPVTGQPIMVRLGQVARFEQIEGASQINRRKLFREVLIQANVEGRPAGDIGDDIAKIQAEMELPAGYSFLVEGANKDMQESIGYAVSALVLAVVFIYMLLSSQFNSFLYPTAIMASLPLSLIGVFLALFMFGSTLNIFSIIGIIMLMGLVTKNAILLIDFIKDALARGDSRETAILDAGQARLRPILMTTAAMVVGMVPLALGLGEGAEQRSPMAHAIIGGTLTSTFLTLIVVPVIYTYLDDFKIWSTRILRRVFSLT